MQIGQLEILNPMPIRSAYETDREYAEAVEIWLSALLPFQQSQNKAIEQTNEVYGDINTKHADVLEKREDIDTKHADVLEKSENVDIKHAETLSKAQQVQADKTVCEEKADIVTQKAQEVSDALQGASNNFIDDGNPREDRTYSSYKTKNLLKYHLPSGIVLIWSGKPDNIPAGWYLCDGKNGTPNLVDKFVMGTSEDVGATGGYSDPTLPAHSHSVSVGSAGNHSHSGTTSTNGAHTHSFGISNDDDWYKQNNADCGEHKKYTGYTDSAGNHNHSLNINSAGNHTHSVSIRTTGDKNIAGKNLPPYYKLAFIMKKWES